MYVIIELLISTLLAAAGQVTWRLGMRSIGPIESYDLPNFFRIFTNWQVDLGLTFYAISTLFWLSALSKKDLSFVYPFIAGTYVLILILSYFLLGERIQTHQLGGAMIVLLGLLIIIKFD